MTRSQQCTHRKTKQVISSLPSPHSIIGLDTTHLTTFHLLDPIEARHYLGHVSVTGWDVITEENIITQFSV